LMQRRQTSWLTVDHQANGNDKSNRFVAVTKYGSQCRLTGVFTADMRYSIVYRGVCFRYNVSEVEVLLRPQSQARKGLVLCSLFMDIKS